MASESSVSSMSTSSVENTPSIASINEENKESTTLIWYDSNIGSRKDTEETKQTLRLINDYVKFYTDLEPCVTYIQSINKEKIFLITSGSKASQLLPRVSSLPQIDSIFIFCLKKERYQHLINEYPNIIGIYVELNELNVSIKEQIELLDKQLQVFSVFDQNQRSIKDLSNQCGEFLWYQLFNYIINRLPTDQQAKQQMIQICKQYYRGNTKELELIDQFDREYQSEDAIRWYSKQSFVYRLVNKALRTEDIDQLYTFRFFIHDLSQSLQREHGKILLSNEEILTVYRGAKLDKKEFDKLKKNQGKLISANGYLSTSRDRSLAMDFVTKPTKRSDVISVLFQIQCHVKQLRRTAVFADISQFSDHPDEQEVLFNLNTCFEIESIQENESFQLIIMNVSNKGELITKDYIKQIQMETEEHSVSIVFGRLMSNLGEYNKSQRYFEQLLKDQNNEDRAWIEFNIGRVLDFKGEWKEALEYYDSAYQRMINHKPQRIKDSAYVLHNIGISLDQKGRYDEALDYYQRALEMREKCYPSGHVKIAQTLNNIGIILKKQGKYDEALEYFQRASKLDEIFYESGHVDIDYTLNNIGNTIGNQANYNEDFVYYQQALEVREKCYPSGHIDIIVSFNNIGNIFDEQGKYDKALEYYHRVLKIQDKYYLSDHLSTAVCLNNIGLLLVKLGKYNEAIDYYQRALKIQEHFYRSGHIDIAASLNRIGNIFFKQANYDVALDYYQRALKMREKYYPSDHVDIAASLNNIGLILYHQGKYDEAIDYYQRALKMLEEYHPSDLTDIALSLDNIGNILFKQRKYAEALGYYQRALKIQEKSYPCGHVDIAKSLNNIGMILFKQGLNDQALEYYQQALKMRENYYPSGHVDIAASLNNIGLILYHQGKYDEALDYYQ